MLGAEPLDVAGKAITSWDVLEPLEQSMLLVDASHALARSLPRDGDLDPLPAADASSAPAPTPAADAPAVDLPVPEPCLAPLDVLSSAFAQDVLTVAPDASPDSADAVVAALADRLVAAAAGSTRGATDVLALGVAALTLFVQANWTGPPPHLDATRRLPLVAPPAAPTVLDPVALPAGVVVSATAAAEEQTAPTEISEAAAGKAEADESDEANEANEADEADGDDAGEAADGESAREDAGAVPFMPTSVKRLNYAYYNDEWHRAAIRLLGLDGEDAFDKCYYPWYLVVASLIFIDAPKVYDALAGAVPSAVVWRARVARARQSTLLARSHTLYSIVVEQGVGVLASFAAVSELGGPDVPVSRIRLGVRLTLEAAYGALDYDRTDLMQAYLLHAQALSGLVIALRGAKGKRTKFQKFTTTHLYVSAQGSLPPIAGADYTELPHELPFIVPNDSPVLLEELTFETPIDEPAVSLDDAAILLALAELIRATHPVSELTDEQVRPFARRALDNGSTQASWAMRAAGLLLKSRVEMRGKRTIERACKQFQRLVELRFADVPSAERPTGVDPAILQVGPAPAERMAYLFALPLPPWWKLLSELGSLYMDHGLPRAALDCYEPMEAWEDIVTCYLSVRATSRAERLVRARLDIDPSPRLWALLGDLMRDPVYYERAWRESGGRFPRAQRAWGKLAFQAKDYAGAIEHFELALAINPIFPEIWFSMGMASMFAQAWEVGSRAFSRVVQLDPTHGEGWANLSGVYQRANEPRKAFHAMEQALKFKREAWRMWENFLYICMQLGELEQAMQALRNKIQYNNAQAQENDADPRVLYALVTHLNNLLKAVRELDPSDTSPDAKALERKAVRFESTLTNLFDFITARITTNPEVWDAHAQLLKIKGAPALSIVESVLKRARAARKPNWEQEASLFEGVADSSLALATELDDIEAVAVGAGDTSVSAAFATLRPSILLLLNSVVARSERFFEDSPKRAELVELVARLEERTASVAAAAASADASDSGASGADAGAGAAESSV
ncbi:tetratricopeptide repeat protein 27 [Thecamonas trahens ATCC 50062]|uniref:Tetratricopeptide repeat protein 27 n=1 Tax=Thecamonas trahens ATCC 50062 TaxID=461836 RepID=A0A0L0DJ71_THETB|nr:tetratricopeptide repeat protein 27 [Thecamonas trahens ATCC 50062]KNC52111.1 tetratricopeptide repeat protein 27 [Thecamonas trahens ATCC 50062]|eukprot:XP_013762115.1 tetratricopeptide repeat protein 27 [Thecamonas trahens ATCC 50062]